MTLYKKAGMWISDWSNKDSDDDQGCDKRQKEQIQKAFDLIGKMEKQGWKEIGFSGYGYQDVGLAKSAKIMKQHSSQLKKAFKAHDDDIKKKWGQKRVNFWNKHLAYRLFLLGDGFFIDFNLERFSQGELGGCAALMQKGNEYRLILTNGSNDDEAGYWSKPVTQIVFKSTAAKPAAKKPKAPARKPKAKAKPKAKPKARSKAKASTKKPKYYLHFGEDFTADKCVYTGKKFAMNTIRSAKALANHMWNLGPMPGMNPGYADFTINGEHYGNIVTWETEIIDANTGEVADRWTPSKEQKATFRKQGNAIKKAAKPAAKKPKAKPRAKAPAKKPVAKPKARPSPSQSAAATKVGTRKRGNDGFMWEVKKSKNGVHRWARDTKSTKRAEDYWYWKV